MAIPAGLYDHTAPILAAAVMQDDELRDDYRGHLKRLAKLLSPQTIGCRR